MRNMMLLIILAFGLSSCTTISRGGTDYLRIDTVPQGAKVTTTIETFRSIENRKNDFKAERRYRSCEPTPCLLKVGRRQAFAIKIEHEGYEPAEIAIHGDIPMRSASIDMAVPAGSIAANMGVGVSSGAAIGTMGVVLTQALSFGLPAPTGSIVAGATAAGAGFGVVMVGVDLASGSFENIYPNPVIVKLAPIGTPTITDPNMLMYKLRQAKKRVANIYCKGREGVKEKQRQKNCEQAHELDKARDIENAELLANEQEIKDMIKNIKQQLQEHSTKAQAAKRGGH